MQVVGKSMQAVGKSMQAVGKSMQAVGKSMQAVRRSMHAVSLTGCTLACRGGVSGELHVAARQCTRVLHAKRFVCIRLRRGLRSSQNV